MAVMPIWMRKRRRKAYAKAVRRTWIRVCWLGGLLFIKKERRNGSKTLLTRKKKGLTKPGPEERKSIKNGDGTNKTEARVRKANRQRKLIQQRIRRWNKTRKLKYDGKDRKKYRHKVKASKRWLWSRSRNDTEAKEANSREHRKRTRKMGGRDMKRKGGAGGRGRARAVNASSIEEEIMKDIGVPQQTWGDGSCWLWAVAGALHKLEGRE
eukprot:1022222-Pleurochrysis_carterae.AAC.1